MTTEEKARAYDEAIERAKKFNIDDAYASQGATIKSIFPQLRESEDEKIRKWLVDYFGSIKEVVWIHRDITCEQILEWLEKQKSKDDEEKYLDGIKRDWFERGKKEVLTVPELYGLEKQKEQPKEELVYRLNGLMQDYIKEGKDDEEKEHRFKCYQLFWDALEDTSYFEQKEQKPAEGDNETEIQKAFREGKSAGRKEVFDHPEEYGLQKEQKPWKVGANAYFTPEQKPAEWSEEDEKMKENLLYLMLENNSQDSWEGTYEWLKSFRPQYHGDVTMTEAYKMGLEVGKASSWKPSEHQMKILKAVKEYVGRGSGYWGEALGSLIEDLEKLM